jgi:putative CocE/NonD family hydrolase
MLGRFGIEQTHPVTIRTGLKVPMPDGVELLTDLYLGSANDKAPVILVRSPYGRSVLLAAGMAYPFAARGYNVVLQSCRGTFGSGGVFDPHRDEQRDGLATIEWIKQQPWYGGAIGTFGPSYLGYTQWAVAAPAGPELKAMAMQVTISDFSLMTYAGDSFSLENAFSWSHMVTMMRRESAIFRMLLSRFTGKPLISARQWLTLPLASMDTKIAGERIHFWQDWLQHSSARDPWWAPMSHRRSIAQVNRPIISAAGWYDIFAPWHLQDFIELQKAGCPCRITIGPWRHQDFGLGQTGLIEALEWFDAHLRGKPLPERKPVKLYVIGADEWRYFDEWPPRAAQVETWHLHPQRQLRPELPPQSQPDQYRYDPADPTPSIGGPALDMVPYSVDNARLESRPDVLTYTSEPLTRARDLIGVVTAELHVTSTAQSADFFVRICDVDTSGVSKNVCDGIQRIRVEQPGVPQRVRVELWPTAYRFAPGHRIRVQVSSGAFPRWARNPGTTEPLGEATTLVAATQSIHHSPTHPSTVNLSFVS